jgi:two-component system sensor histidine kinase DegS
LGRTHFDLSYLNKVIDSTIEAVEKGQNEIYNICEHAKQECERLEMEIERVKQKVKQIIERVDILEKQETLAKHRLIVVSKDFDRYEEEDIKNAYEQAKDIQIELTLEKEREEQYRVKRDELERSYKSMSTILRQSEHLTVQVGVVLNFLKGNLEDISGHLSSITQKQSFAEQIIKAQEEERKRVSRDIHDGPAQTLANIIIQTDICEKLCEKEPEKAKKELKELKHIVRVSLKELRKIIFDLRPSALDDLGLESVVQRYCAEFQEQTGINTIFKIFGDRARADSNIEVALFRIIQEALVNVKKHSCAKNALVRLEINQDIINMIISDDGKGFEFNVNSSLKAKEHFGIMSIKERAELFGGTVKIESFPGEGTKIYITMPFK